MLTITNTDRLPRKARIILVGIALSALGNGLVLLSIIMVGQDASTLWMQQKIDETHTASLAEFELAKQSQEIANKEMTQLREITSEMHKLIRDIEKRSK